MADIADIANDYAERDLHERLRGRVQYQGQSQKECDDCGCEIPTRRREAVPGGAPVHRLPERARGQAPMKLTCLFLGCRWGEPVRFKSWREVFVQRKCQRCGALTTKVDRRWS